MAGDSPAKMSFDATPMSATILPTSQPSGTVQSAENPTDTQPALVTKPNLETPTLLLTVLTALLLIIASLIIAISSVVLQRLSGQLSNFPLIALYLNTFIYFILALSSLVGFYIFFPRPAGQKTLKVKRLQFLSSTYATLFVLSLAVSIICLYLLFMPHPPAALPDAQAAALTLNRTSSRALEQGVGMCAPAALANAHDAILVSLCHRSTSLRISGVTLVVLGWLVNLAITIFVNLYTQRLQKLAEDDFDRNLSIGDDDFDWHY